MTDQTPPPDDSGPHGEEPGDGPGDGPGWDDFTALRRQVATDRQELRRLVSRAEVRHDQLRASLRSLLVCTAMLSAGMLVLGSLMKLFVPVSGDDRSLTLYQVLDPEKDPDLLDHSSSWGTGAGWFIPIAMVLICAVLVLLVAAGTNPGALITVTEIFCWCLSIGCVFGFAVLAGMTGVVGVPPGLVTILVGGALGITTCRIARARRD